MTDSFSMQVKAPTKKPLKRLVILISGSGTNLQAIIDALEAGKLGEAEIAAVISNRPGVGGLERAARHHIPTLVIDHTTVEGREAYDQTLAAAVADLKPDWVILAGFMRILTRHFIEPFLGKIINIHPSLLPKHKGLHTHLKAIQEGDRHHGCSVHFVTLDLDSGPVIGQSSLPIAEALTHDAQTATSEQQKHEQQAQQLQLAVQKLEHKLYPECILWLVQERLRWDQDNNQVYLDGAQLPISGHPV